MQDFAGKTALITGGASGIGLGMARNFLRAGMQVCLADWNDQHIEQARAELAGSNGVLLRKTDVSDRGDMHGAVADCVEAFGGLHILCANAGTGGGGVADSEDFDDWDRSISVNLGGVINAVKLALPQIKVQGEGGHVVITSSMAGIVPLPGLAAYSTAKYAVRGFAESLRIQMAPQGIGVSCLFPGATRTAIVPVPEPDSPAWAEADDFTRTLWNAMLNAIDPNDTGAAVLEAIRENRFYIFTNREFLPEVIERHRELESAFPEQDPPPERIEFENLRREMVKQLMATGGPKS
ncbi:MAG: SDR family oxidoreductase [Sphingomonadaceae bacterium]|nr:SDR family oxidoreductase [Sphingomonadaceae bacterium]